MADIELVIKIPEEYFEIMKHNIAVNNPLCPISQENMVAIVAHGTPLPKGHGRLIDADALETHDEYDGQGFTESVYKDDIDALPTNVEADKTEREDTK